MSVNTPEVPYAEMSADSKLLRLAWFFNAVAVSLVEAQILLKQLPEAKADLEYLLNEADLPADRRAFLQAELARFQRECEALKESLEEAGRLAHGE